MEFELVSRSDVAAAAPRRPGPVTRRTAEPGLRPAVKAWSPPTPPVLRPAKAFLTDLLGGREGVTIHGESSSDRCIATIQTADGQIFAVRCDNITPPALPAGRR